MKNTQNELYQSGLKQEWSVFSYIHTFFTPQEWKTTVILLYTVFAMTLWVYIPRAPRLLLSAEIARMEFSGSEADTVMETRKKTGTETEMMVETYVLQLPSGADSSRTFTERVYELMKSSQQIFGVFLLFGMIPAFIVKFIFREQLSAYGLALGNWRYARNILLLALPLALVSIYVSAKSPVYLGTYPYTPWILGGYETFQEGWPFMMIHFVLYLFCYYLSWEFFFRGFIQLGTGTTVGCVNAVLIGTITSTAVHFGPSAMSETVGAIVGGLAWGYFVFRTRSILTGWIMHAALGIFLDFFLLYHFLP
ncbi:MAG: CPBP family intramembrane metalloprotease [Planctomycetia bacterium]|nr:CPBP family intramembrane metalloprotease [Planctomycetia bacterium]